MRWGLSRCAGKLTRLLQAQGQTALEIKKGSMNMYMCAHSHTCTHTHMHKNMHTHAHVHCFVHVGY